MNPGAKFTEEQLHVLDTKVYDPDASYIYELMSGSFLWSDEFPEENPKGVDFYDDNYCYRFLITYRRSLTLGEPKEEWSHLWQQVQISAPNWPGLRKSRYTGRIVSRLKAAIRISSYKMAKDFAEQADISLEEAVKILDGVEE